MIAKVKEIKVDTVMNMSDTRACRFILEMANLIGKYVEVFPMKNQKEWYGMRREYKNNLFVFHKNWLEFDMRRMSKRPIELPVNTPFEARTQEGILTSQAIMDMRMAVSNFDKDDSDVELHIRWPDIAEFAIQSPLEWYLYRDANKRTPDQHYRDCVMSRYGVQVPDAICTALLESAKKWSTPSTTAEFEIKRFGGDLANHYSLYSRYELLADVVSFNGWLVIFGNQDKYTFAEAHALINFLGKDNYSLCIINVKDKPHSVCIYRKNSRPPVETLTYEVR